MKWSVSGVFRKDRRAFHGITAIGFKTLAFGPGKIAFYRRFRIAQHLEPLSHRRGGLHGKSSVLCDADWLNRS
jgi:hypothetical protein